MTFAPLRFPYAVSVLTAAAGVAVAKFAPVGRDFPGMFLLGVPLVLALILPPRPAFLGVARDFNNLLTAIFGFCDLNPSLETIAQKPSTAAGLTRKVREVLSAERAVR
jgi:hypothetical protein